MTLKSLIKGIAYRVGGLGAVHHMRNRDTLSVLMFHRVIAPGADAWAGANPLFTLSTGFFVRLLKFIKRHYNPVGLEAVAAARRGEKDLPPRALLISFDDGWADNVEFAAPLLKQAGLPAVFFVATGAVKSGEAFWQEKLYAGAATSGRYDGPREIMQLVSQASALTQDARDAIVADHELTDATALPQMMTPDDVARLSQDPLFDFGTHGVSHTPFTEIEDPQGELERSWSDLSSWCSPSVRSLSFPHGRSSPQIMQQALHSGYELVFNSDQILNSDIGAPAFGRFEIRPPGTDPHSDDFGIFAPDDFDAGRIAAEMFLRPRSGVDAPPTSKALR